MSNKSIVIRISSLVIALLAGLILFNPRDGRTHALVWIPKLIVAAFSPLLVLLGIISTLLGFLRKDPLALGLGVFSTMVSAKHISDVTAARGRFEETFGPDWESQVTPHVRAHFAPYRWGPFIKKQAPGALAHNIVYGINGETGRPLLADIMKPSAVLL